MTPLNQTEVDRLDSRVNIALLEELLSKLPDEQRALVLNSFLLEPDQALGVVVGSVNPTLNQLISRIWEHPIDASDATRA